MSVRGGETVSKNFNDFRKLINDEEIVAKVIDKSPLSKGVSISFGPTPEGLEKYQNEVAKAIVGTAMTATIDFLQIYHQWANGDLDKDK